MRLRTILIYCSATALLATAGRQALAQDSPAKRLAGIVTVAVEEYRLGVSASGGVLSQMELDEARAFLSDARGVAARLDGPDAARIRVLVDSLADAAVRRVAPATVDSLYQRFALALGPDAALDLPTRPIDLARGGTLYRQHCASCHGATGKGDGPDAAGLNPAPPALADTAMRGVAPALMYRVVSVGVQGTSMAAWASVLSPDERWDVVQYANTLRANSGAAERGAALLATTCARCASEPDSLADFAWLADRTDHDVAAALPVEPRIAYDVVAWLRSEAGRRVPNADRALDARAVSRAVIAQLDTALSAATSGRRDEANDRAFDAYVTFEPLENRVRARNPGLVARIEREFLAFRGAVQTGDDRAAFAALERIRVGIGGVTDIAGAPVQGWAAFVQSLVIILREGLEAILIIGAVLALLARTGHGGRTREVWIGVGLAVVASIATAIVLQTTLAALPASREVIEGITMLVAVAVLFSASYWVLSKVESQRWQAYVRDRVGTAVSRGGTFALAGVAFLVVYREGAETVLFYQALMTAGGTAIISHVAGGFIAGALVLAAVLYSFRTLGRRVPLAAFFATTGALLYVMAFAFLGNGLRELQEGGVLPITPVRAPALDVLGVYPTAETLGAQAVLLVLLGIACWISFAAPRLATARARRAAATARGALGSSDSPSAR